MHSSSDDPDYTEFTEGPKEKTNHDFDVKWTNKEKASEEDDKEGEEGEVSTGEEGAACEGSVTNGGGAMGVAHTT
jgi:hypothetical protein